MCLSLYYPFVHHFPYLLSCYWIRDISSQSERAIRPFCIGKKNWVLIDSVKGAEASALAYSIAESAKLNSLKPYEYYKYLLTELPNRMDEKNYIDPSSLDDLMPWSDSLPEECYKRHKNGA